MSDNGMMRTVLMCPQANTSYSLGLQKGLVRMGESQSEDTAQQWQIWSTSVKDEHDKTGFCLVNMASGQALVHTVTVSGSVFLVDFDPDRISNGMIWTTGNYEGTEFSTIRDAYNITHTLKALGTVGNSSFVGLEEWVTNEDKNVMWKLKTVTT